MIRWDYTHIKSRLIPSLYFCCCLGVYIFAATLEFTGMKYSCYCLGSSVNKIFVVALYFCCYLVFLPLPWSLNKITL